MVSVEVVRHPPISTARQILMNVYWFSINMMWASLFLIIMPYHIQALAGIADKGKILALVLSSGAIVSIFAAPFFRALSDHVHLPGGRRKSWILIGAVAVMIQLWVLSGWTKSADAASLPGWITAFLFLQIFGNAVSAPCGALISGQVPATQHNSTIDWQGLMTMLGIFTGAAMGFLIAPLGISVIFNILIIVIFAGTLLTLFFTHELTPLTEKPPLIRAEFLKSLYIPFKNTDFGLMFLNRLLIGMGMFTIQEFILYYMNDAFMAPYTLPVLGQVTNRPEGAASIFFVAVFLGAITASLIIGFAGTSRRKAIAYVASLMFGMTCMIFTFSRSFSLSIFMGVIFGMGYGAYDRVAWSMVSDVLPSIKNYGKNIGIWHIAVVFPQVIATPIGGLLLDHFQKIGAAQNIHHMGYIVIFIVAVAYFMLGSIFLRKIKGLS